MLNSRGLSTALPWPFGALLGSVLLPLMASVPMVTLVGLGRLIPMESWRWWHGTDAGNG